MVEENNAFFQVAWVVDNLQKSIERWLTTANVGPFFICPHVKVEHIQYRGRPAAIDFSSALVQAGPIQIELIEQHNDGPSAYRDMFQKGREGFHHMCMMTNAFDAEIERHHLQGSEVATQGQFGDMRFAYVDTRERLGHMTEIIEDRVSIREFFKVIADAAINWDGMDPIRSI